jgi:hypothetical protein
MGGGVSSQEPVVAQHAWLARSDASVKRQPELPPLFPERDVETAQTCGPRNPVLRAFDSLGRHLSRTFAPVIPACARRAGASAERDVRTQLAQVLDHLAAGDVPAATLEADLRRLGAAQRDWAKLDGKADAKFANAVEELLDQHWPGDQGLALLQALAKPAVENAQRAIQDDHDLEAQRVLIQLADAVMHTVTERAVDSIRHRFDGALVLIQNNAMSSKIAEDAERAVTSGAAILSQLRSCGALALTALPNAAAGARDELEAEQTAMILKTILAQALETAQPRSEDRAEDLATLLQHLSSQSLERLRRSPVTGADEAVTRVNAALENEIAVRPARLLAKLRVLVYKESESFSPTLEGKLSRQRSSTIVSHTFGNDLEKAGLLKEQILVHCALFGLASDGDTLRTLFDTIDSSASELMSQGRVVNTNQLAKARNMAGSVLTEKTVQMLVGNWQVRIAALESTAEQSANKLLAALTAGDTAAQLAACKEMVSAFHAHLKAEGLEGTAQSDDAKTQRLQQTLFTMLKKPDFEAALEQNGARVLDALSGQEMQAVIAVLTTAEEQLRGQEGLEAERAELADVLGALRTLAAAIDNDPASTPVQVPGPEALQPETLEQLERLFGTLVLPYGQVRLTKGTCAAGFATAIGDGLKRTLSEDELSCANIAGIAVPTQFIKDAERQTTQYYMNDGQPLIDRKGWNLLGVDEKNQRIAEGYKRLVAFFDNNEQQTQAIVRLANQTLSAGLQAAQVECSDQSPMVLEGHGAGVVLPHSSSARCTISVSFSMGKNHLPRAQFSYEVLGGELGLVQDGLLMPEGNTFLDTERSRAKITLTVEARPGQSHLTMTGTPIYDVHLVKSALQRPYSLPLPEHLHDGAPELYEDLLEFSITRASPDTVAALQLMRDIMRAQRATEPQRAYERARNIYDSYLGEDPRGGLRAPACLGDAAAKQIRDSFQSFDRASSKMLFVFDQAVAAMGKRIKMLLPNWKPPRVPGSAASEDSEGATGNATRAERDRPIGPSIVRREHLDALCAALREDDGEGPMIADFLTAVEAFLRNGNRTVEDAQQILAAFVQEPLFPSSVVKHIRESIAAVDTLRDDCSGDALNLLFTALRPVAENLLPAFREYLLAEQAQAQSQSPASIRLESAV